MSEHKFSFLGAAGETDFSLYYKAKQRDLTFSYPVFIVFIDNNSTNSLYRTFPLA